MSSAVEKNIETAEEALAGPLPPRLREFLLDLYDHQVSFKKDNWNFPVVSQEIFEPYENPLILQSMEFRQQWGILGFVFASNEIGDKLVVLSDEADDSKFSEQIYVLIGSANLLKFFSADIYAAYQGDFFYSGFEKYYTWKLGDNGHVVRGKEIWEDVESQTSQERFFIDEYDRRKSMVDDMIDNEETDKHQEIIDTLHDLTEQEDYARWAWFKLSDLYFKGFGPIPVNIDQALQYNQHAVDLGHPQSMANRAFCYLSGIGLEKNVEKAYELIKAANDKTLHGSDEESDGLFYEMLLAIKSEYLKQKKR